MGVAWSWRLDQVIQFRNFGTLITFERKDLSASKFGTEMEDGPAGVWNIKLLNGRGLGQVTQFQNFETTFERKELSASNLVQT